jgi:hypothetical protein
VPRPPVAGDPGVPPTTPPAPPGTFPVPTPVEPGKPVPTLPGPPATPPGTPPPTGELPATPPRDPDLPAGVPPPGAPAPGTAAQVIITTPGTEMRLAGGPYTVPLSINNAVRVSVMTLTVTYNPNVLRVRTVQDGSFMRQGAATVTFTPRIDAAAGRVDIAITRSNDPVGASGAGLLGALVFDAIGPGNSLIQVAGVASTPEGEPVNLQFSPVTVTVR